MLFCGHNVTLVPPSLQEIQNSEKHFPSHQKFKFQGCRGHATGPKEPPNQEIHCAKKHWAWCGTNRKAILLACRMINVNVFYFHSYILHFFVKTIVTNYMFKSFSCSTHKQEHAFEARVPQRTSEGEIYGVKYFYLVKFQRHDLGNIPYIL